jgi:uncharacterized Zn-binding protein involved in type VI secretion
MAGVARIGDKIVGSCRGQYRKWEHIRDDPIWGEDEEGNPVIIGYDPVYDWVYYWETGTVTGSIITGSSNVKVNGRGVARIGDQAALTKHYANSNHLDSLNVVGTITSGSSSVKANNQKIAYVGSTLEAQGCSRLTIESGSPNVYVN